MINEKLTLEFIQKCRKENATVAHYSRLEHLANILHDKRLLLNQVCKTHDPRESSLGWINIEGIGHGPDNEGLASAKNQKKTIGRQLRLLSTAIASAVTNSYQCPIESLHCGKPRMWAQYAQGNQGFCVILDKEKLNNAIKSIAKKDKFLISKSVIYVNYLHGADSSVTIEYGNSILPRDSFELISENQMLESVYFKKSEDWQGENEYRWLLYDDSPDETCVSIEDSIEAVVLGDRFPLNQIDAAKFYCKNLKCACLQLRYNHPRYNLLPL